MSLHRVDPRFALPHAVRHAVVLDGLAEWRAGLESAGVEVLEVAARVAPDLVVCTAARAREAATIGGRSVIVEGSSEQRFADGRWRAQRLVLRPTRSRPTLALPLDHPAAASYALERWSVVDRRWKRLRLGLARPVVSRGRFPGWASPIVTVATCEAGPPAFVGAARELGIPDDAAWFLTFGQGDALSRNAFQLFPASSDRPAWVLKFARVPGYAWRFDSDERGLRLAHAAGERVARHVPQLVGRFDLDGVYASVETAATGRRLRDVLAAPGDRTRKLALVERVADWIIELGRGTQASSEALAAERERLRSDVVPRWRQLGVGAELVDELPPLSSVVHHNDLGTWNVLAGDDGGFGVLDWENARPAGLPLWDLLYFLADALTVLDGPAEPGRFADGMAHLFAGEAPSSAVLFAWVRRGAEAAGVPAAAVGPIATLCWLSHSLASEAHNADIAVFAPGDPPRQHGFDELAAAWLRHPGLGPTWSAWLGNGRRSG